MPSFSSESTRFSVLLLDEDKPEETSILISGYVLMGDKLQTKLGADFRLPPAKAIELAKLILKAAYNAAPIEAPAAVEAA